MSSWAWYTGRAGYVAYPAAQQLALEVAFTADDLPLNPQMVDIGDGRVVTRNDKGFVQHPRADPTKWRQVRRKDGAVAADSSCTATGPAAKPTDDGGSSAPQDREKAKKQPKWASLRTPSADEAILLTTIQRMRKAGTAASELCGSWYVKVTCNLAKRGAKAGQPVTILTVTDPRGGKHQSVKSVERYLGLIADSADGKRATTEKQDTGPKKKLKTAAHRQLGLDWGSSDESDNDDGEIGSMPAKHGGACSVSKLNISEIDAAASDEEDANHDANLTESDEDRDGGGVSCGMRLPPSLAHALPPFAHTETEAGNSSVPIEGIHPSLIEDLD